MERLPPRTLAQLAEFLRSHGIPITGITDTTPPAIQFQAGATDEERARVGPLLEEFSEWETD